MDYIPKRVLFEKFPSTGIDGLTALEAFDLALDGELAAYYHIPAGFELEGASKRMYGDFHGPLARLPIGKLEYLQAHGAMRFSKTIPFQALGFYGPNFGPPHDQAAIRLQFELEDSFWLFLKGEDVLDVSINRVIFMRDDLEKAAHSRSLNTGTGDSPAELEDLRKQLEQERLACYLAADEAIDLRDELGTERAARLSAERRAEKAEAEAANLRKTNDKAIDLRERASFERLVFALAHEAGYRLEKPYADADLIILYADTIGAKVPTGKGLIAKKLEAAAARYAQDQKG
jgi:hypothetical protein